MFGGYKFVLIERFKKHVRQTKKARQTKKEKVKEPY
jgi:hypothetical protein